MGTLVPMKRFATGLFCALAIPLVVGVSACSTQSSTEGAASTAATTTMAQEIPEFVEKCQVKPISSEKKKAEKEDEKAESGASEPAKASGSKTAAKSSQADSASKDSGETAMVPEQFLTKDVTLTLKTTAGDIPMKLTASKTPCAASTIASLAKQGFYNKTVCHRITTEEIYVLQCGDPDGTGEGGPGFVFKDEYPVGTDQSNLYKPGVVAMANAGQNTNGSQFFVTYADSPLPAYYTIFGSVSEAGMKTVQAIAKKGTKGGVPDGQPSTEVRIDKAVVSE